MTEHKAVPFTHKDLDALSPLQPDGWPDIRNDFRFYLDNGFCCPVKVTARQQIIGVGVLILFGITGWVAHIIVDPNRRNRGLGLFIVRHLLEAAEQKGCRSVSLVATDLGYPVYLKAGFAAQTRYLFFSRENRDRADELETAHIRRATTGDRADILALDREISGENRSALISGFLRTAWVCDANHTVNGYYLPGLREGTILALDEPSGLELMAWKYRDVHSAVLPAENRAGIRFLKVNGFQQVMTAKRMVWGHPFTWHPRGIFSRIAGNFG